MDARLLRRGRAVPSFLSWMDVFDREIIHKTANRSIKNFCKVMMAANLFRSAASLCAISSATRVGNHRAVAAIRPVKGDAVFVSQIFWRGIDGQRPISAGGELSTYCKDSVNRPAN